MQARVSAATAEHKAARGPDNPMTQMRLRYFDSALGAAAKKGAADFVPGVISQQLADALGEWRLCFLLDACADSTGEGTVHVPEQCSAYVRESCDDHCCEASAQL